MKFFQIFAFAVLTFATTGCESVSERMSERFAPVSPIVKSFQADKKTVFLAAQRALKRMDYVVTRSAASQGIINARSGIRDTAVFGAGRQFTFEIKIRAADATSTDVEVILTELLEGDFRAGATAKPLRAHGLYDSFFEQLGRALLEPAP